MAYTRLSVIEREEISRSLAEDSTVSWSVLGRTLGRHRSSVAREVERNGGRSAYRAAKAQRRAREAMPCRHHRLLEPALAAKVRSHLHFADAHSPCNAARTRKVSSTS